MVDLATQSVATADGSFVREFSIDPFVKHCLLEGLDDIGLTLMEEDAITAFEGQRDAAIYPSTAA